MKTLPFISALMISASPAIAAPYCEALLDADQLEKRYQRLAPIFNDDQTGWIFTSDQLDTDYDMSSEAMMLMTSIVEAINAHDTSLAILTAPPRPVIAGQTVVDTTMGEAGAFDVANAQVSFAKMITQLREAGAIVPNLQDVALAAEEAAPYYFRRDTHWTTTGAAQSAVALAVELGHAAPFVPADLDVLDAFEERGSLSDIVEASCDLRDKAEVIPVYDYSFASAGIGLLDDSDADRVQAVLLGTSFSNRYRRDQYQVADALAAALDADVDNRSISGGGLIGPIEEYVLSGDLGNDDNDLIIWEFPYTEGLNTSALRQLLGALLAPRALAIDTRSVDLEDDKASFDLSLDAQAANLLHIQLDTDAAKEIKVDLTFADGTKKTIKLRRKSSMQEVAQHVDWYAHIGGFKYGSVTSITLRIDPSADVTAAQIALLGSAVN